MEYLFTRSFPTVCYLCKKPLLLKQQTTRHLNSVSFIHSLSFSDLIPKFQLLRLRHFKRLIFQLNRSRSHNAVSGAISKSKIGERSKESSSGGFHEESVTKSDIALDRGEDIVQYSKTVIEQTHDFADSKNGSPSARRDETIFDAPDVKPLSFSERHPKWTKAYATFGHKKKLNEFLTLGKIRLTSFVVVSAMGGHLIAPVSVSPSCFAALSVGVLLTSMSANSMNQFLEAPYDAQMARTQNRPLVKRSLTPEAALCFSVFSGALGCSTLLWGCNALTAGIGLANIVLYTSVYTPLKRVSIVNTWIGSLVGALPPLMGWTAATGSLCPTAFIMPLVLYSWQFPHFNALSWNLRSDYSRAGYQMMSVTDPALSKRVAFRHTLLLFPICLAAPLSGLTMWFFALDSTLLNMYFAYLGYHFYRDGDSKSARALFRFSLVYLPLVVGLMLCSKYWDCFTLFKDGRVLALRHPKTYHSAATTNP